MGDRRVPQLIRRDPRDIRRTAELGHSPSRHVPIGRSPTPSHHHEPAALRQLDPIAPLEPTQLDEVAEISRYSNDGDVSWTPNGSRLVIAAEPEGSIDAEMDIIENGTYHRLLLMYKGELDADALLAETQGADGIENATA